jgi:hypothetical protein
MDFEKQIGLISLEISNEMKRFEESLILSEEPKKENKFIDFQKKTLPATKRAKSSKDRLYKKTICIKLV